MGSHVTLLPTQTRRSSLSDGVGPPGSCHLPTTPRRRERTPTSRTSALVQESLNAHRQFRVIVRQSFLPSSASVCPVFVIFPPRFSAPVIWSRSSHGASRLSTLNCGPHPTSTPLLHPPDHRVSLLWQPSLLRRSYSPPFLAASCAKLLRPQLHLLVIIRTRPPTSLLSLQVPHRDSLFLTAIMPPSSSRPRQTSIYIAQSVAYGSIS